MRIVLTGAAGFLGQKLVEKVRRSGSTAVPVVRDATAAVARGLGGAVSMSDVLADPSKLSGADVLVHAAAIRHRYGAAPDDYRASNVDLVSALIRAAARRVGRFVFVSSVGVYGFPTEDALPIDERAPFAPRTLYSETKIEAEAIVAKLAPELGLAYTIVRPTIIYGKGDTNGMLDKLARMIRARRYLLVGSGQNTLHHTHVDDVVRGILELAARDQAKNEDFILAGPETITLARLSELVARTVGGTVPPVRVPLRLARAVATGVDLVARRGLAWTRNEPPINHEKLDVMTLSIAFDASKARRAGFTATIDYEEGIARTLGATG